MPPQGRLLSHFQHATKHTQGAKWDALWTTGEQHLWDRGRPSPPLETYLRSSECIVPHTPHASHQQPRPRALVPACGTGYDAVMLAQLGFDAIGIDISETAIHAANAYAGRVIGASNMDETRVEPLTGDVRFYQGDFFTQEWQAALPSKQQEKFDLVYDYTFLCALVPESRKDWSRRMGELVKPGSFLICLEFPLWKDNKIPGPPWGMSGVYWNLLAQGGDGVVDSGSEDGQGSGDGKFERVQYLKPPESYEQGRSTDMLSVWKRKGTD